MVCCSFIARAGFAKNWQFILSPLPHLVHKWLDLENPADFGIPGPLIVIRVCVQPFWQSCVFLGRQLIITLLVSFKPSVMRFHRWLGQVIKETFVIESVRVFVTDFWAKQEQIGIKRDFYSKFNLIGSLKIPCFTHRKSSWKRHFSMKFHIFDKNSR